VDRVLNRRHPVRPGTAERVLAAAQSLGYHATGLIKQRLQEAPQRTLGFILQTRKEEFYRNLGAALVEATDSATAIRGRAVVEYLDDLTPASIVSALHRLGAKADAVAIVAADHPNISQAIEELHRKGVPTFALLSDLTAPCRAGYLGLDHRKAGRTAAWTVSRLARGVGKVAIVIGSHRYLGHELCEISFRSYFREHAPGFQLLEPLVNLEEPRLAYEGTFNLLRRNEDLVGIYVAGGGVEGVVSALREAGRSDRLVVVCSDLTQVTREALIEGVVDLVISNPLAMLGEKAVGAMVGAIGRTTDAANQILLPFELYLSENV
jgi:LacI family transcriptional regulator